MIGQYTDKSIGIKFGTNDVIAKVWFSNTPICDLVGMLTLSNIDSPDDILVTMTFTNVESIRTVANWFNTLAEKVTNDTPSPALPTGQESCQAS